MPDARVGSIKANGVASGKLVDGTWEFLRKRKTMPNWITLSGDNIKLLDTEVTIMASISPLQDLDTCVTSAANYVRGYIEAGGNVMEPAPTVPVEVVDDVISIGRYRYLAQEPTGTLISAVRQKEFDACLKHLEDIAKGISTVTQGEGGTIDQFGKWGSVGAIKMRT